MTPENEKKLCSLFDQESARLKELNKKSTSKISPLARFFTIVFTIIAIAVAVSYGVWAYAFVGLKMWMWFLIPALHIEPITLYQCMGIMFLVRLFTSENPFALSDSIANCKDNPTEAAVRIFGILAHPWMLLLFAYVIHKL